MKRSAIAIAWLGVLTICIVVIVVCAPHDHHGVNHHTAHRLAAARAVRQQIALTTIDADWIASDATASHNAIAHPAASAERDGGRPLPLLRI